MENDLYIRADGRIWYHGAFENNNRDTNTKRDYGETYSSFATAISAGTVDDYVDGVVGDIGGNGCYDTSHYESRDEAVLLVRKDGRIESLIPATSGDQSVAYSRWVKEDNYDIGPPFGVTDDPPDLIRGLKYIAVTNYDDYTIYLRSDGQVVYRGRVCKNRVDYEMPKLPGLRYLDVDKNLGNFMFYRSDGEIVEGTPPYDPPYGNNTKRDTMDYYRQRFPRQQSTPKLAKGWHLVGPPYFVSGNYIEKGLKTSVHHTFYVVEKIRGKVDSGIVIHHLSEPGIVATVDKNGSVKETKHTKTRLYVSVRSRAVLKGGKVVVKDYRGKIVGKATVAKSANLAITVKTTLMKKRKKKQKLSVQFLGSAQANPSGIAKTTIVVR
jgi:hypothetical protein